MGGKSFEISDKEKSFVKAIDKALGILFVPINEIQVEEIRELAETYREDQIEIVAKKAGMTGIKRGAILGWMRKGLEEFDRLYADESGPGRNGLSPEKRESIKRDLKILEEKFAESIPIAPSRFPDGKDRWYEESLRRINNHRKVLGQPERVMPDYVGCNTDGTPGNSEEE